MSKTGGVVVNEEEFVSEVFEKSLIKYINQVTSESASYNARMKVYCSKELYLSGLLGPAKLIEKDKDFPKDGDNLIGESGGHSYYLSNPINTFTYLLFFSHRNV